MTHAQKLQRMYQHLPTLGIPENVFAPPLYAMFWKLGMPIAPPLFAGFWSLTLLFSIIGALAFAFLQAFVPLPIEEQVAAAAGPYALPLALGLIVGVGTAYYYRRLARTHGLPAWSDYRA